MPPKVSIIIPVFNTEKYIAKCLKSIASQTYEDFEALIIDDGSTDRSIEIAKKITSNDVRFHFFSQPNSGQGSARNLGLDKAKGSYISFIDSDDYVHHDFLKIIMDSIMKNDFEICMCDVIHVNESGYKLKIINNNIDKYKNKNDILNVNHYISNYMCDKIFSRYLFDQLRFSEKIRTYEDVNLIYKLIFNRKIGSTRIALYYYLQREGSTSRSLSPTFLEDRLNIIMEKKKFLNYSGGIKNSNDIFEYAYIKSYYFLCALQYSRYSENYKADVNKLISSSEKNIIRTKNVSKFFMKNKKLCVATIIFNISPSLFKIIFRYIYKS